MYIVFYDTHNDKSTVDKTYSTMRRLKLMSENRLSRSASLNVHHEIKVDADEVLNILAKLLKNGILFFNVFLIPKYCIIRCLPNCF